MGLLRWLHLDPCASGHLPVLVPPLHEDLVIGKCGRCGIRMDRCLPDWCVIRDGDCLKCGWPEPKGTL